MAANLVKIKLSLNDRHSVFNPVAMQSIRTFKIMACAGLSDVFCFFEVQSAALVKNRVRRSAPNSASLTVALRQ